MANLYITEFSDMQPMSVGGALGQMPLWPAVTTQQISIGAGSVQSAPFNPRTRMIRVNTDSICSIAIGSNPTATNTANRMSANTTEYFGVQPGTGQQLAVTANV